MTRSAPQPSGVSTEDRYEAVPADPSGTGILILAGSSGRIERERAELFAAHGIRAHAIRWFGGRDQRPAPHEVPLELFIDELERLRGLCDRVAILGTSFGAEAALLTATLAPVDVVIAIAPSSVVWPWVDDGVWSSHWTRRGVPVPWVPLSSDWSASTDPPEFESLYRASLQQAPDAAERAAIPVELIDGEILLIAGDDDRVWPSGLFCDAIVSRRAAAGRTTAVIRHPTAGHRIPFPGESAPVGGQRMARGGTPEVDQALGAAAWEAIRSLLDLR